MSVTLLLYNLKLNFLMFFYQSTQLTDYIYTDIYCKLTKYIGQTSCSYEHYLVFVNVCQSLYSTSIVCWSTRVLLSSTKIWTSSKCSVFRPAVTDNTIQQ